MNRYIVIRDNVAGRSGLGVALLMAASLNACVTTGDRKAALLPTPQAPAVVASEVAAVAAVAAVATNAAAAVEPLGIDVKALRLSAGGFMLDLRYRVVDAERARPLLDRRVPAYLVDEASGARLGVPSTAKLGTLRQGTHTNIQTDRDYGMLFGNPGCFLKPGAKVTLVAGEVRLPNLTVQ